VRQTKQENRMAKRTFVISLTGLVLCILVTAFLLLSRNRFYTNQYNKGKVFIEQKKYEDAAKAFKKATWLKKKSTTAWLELARSQFLLRKYDVAIGPVNRSLAYDSLLREAYLYRGMIYAKKMMFAEAIADYNTALRLDSLYGQVYYFRAISLAGKGDFHGSIADYKKAKNFYIESIEAFLKSIDANPTLEDYKVAVSDYNRAIEPVPENYEALFSRGCLKATLDDLDGAIDDLDKAISIKADNPELFLQRGVVLAKKGDFTASVKDFTFCINKNHALPKSLYNRALSYMHDQKLKEAEKDARLLKELEPENADAYYILGNICSIKNDWAGSIPYYDKAIKFRPAYAEAYFNRAVSRGNLNQHKEAISDFDIAIKLKKDFAEAYYGRAISKISTQSSTREGCIDLKKALSLGYKDAQNMINIYCN
jgi:tetratricopeptide (TPR) repeat protein